MRRLPPARRRQHGAFNMLFLSMAVVMFSLMGMMVDLARVMARRAELQVAADAAALAGAKSLQTAPDQYSAARTAAGKGINHFNSFNSSNPQANFIVLGAPTIKFGATKNAATWYDGSSGTPAGLRFVRVDSSLSPGDAHGKVELMLMQYMHGMNGATELEVSARAVAGPLGANVGLHL